MTLDYVFMARFAPETDGGYLVTFPDVPEAITQGDDMADALTSANDALGVAGGTLIAVPVDAETALKIAVIEAFAASGLTKVEFARRLGKTANEPYRILDPDHPTRLGVLKDARAVLGKQVIVSVRDAA